MKFNLHSFLSSLWVMGGFEFMREMEKLDERPKTKETYEMFRRVRIPMTKFKIPETRYKPDYPADFGSV